MPKRLQKEKTSTKQEEEEVSEEGANREKADDLKSEMDDILDDIDAVLEENAEEFINSYVQKGGEFSLGFGPHQGGHWCRIGTWNQTMSQSVPSVQRSLDLLEGWDLI